MEIPQKFRKIAGMLTVHLNRDVSGNPGGRPIGSVSIVGMIRKKFEEQPEYAEEWVDKLLEDDPSNRKAVMEQIDGKPKQLSTTRPQAKR